MKAAVALILGVALVWHTACSGTKPDSDASTDPPFRIVRFAPEPAKSEVVSLVRVLANPNAMNGVPVTVGGYMHLEFEGNRLCLHRDDVEQMIRTNCVSLSVPDVKRAMVLNDRYVMVEGVVDGQNRGHLGMLQAGGIGGVTAIAAGSRAALERQNAKEREQWRKEHP
jgi:hypothetical protein